MFQFVIVVDVETTQRRWFPRVLQLTTTQVTLSCGHRSDTVTLALVLYGPQPESNRNSPVSRCAPMRIANWRVRAVRALTCPALADLKHAEKSKNYPRDRLSSC